MVKILVRKKEKPTKEILEVSPEGGVNTVSCLISPHSRTWQKVHPAAAQESQLDEMRLVWKRQI